MGGPEIDFLLQGEKTIVLGEAKWRSGEGSRQGPLGDKTQLQLRREFCDTIGPRISCGVRFVVLSVVRGVPLAADSDPASRVLMRTVTWAELASWTTSRKRRVSARSWATWFAHTCSEAIRWKVLSQPAPTKSGLRAVRNAPTLPMASFGRHKSWGERKKGQMSCSSC